MKITKIEAIPLTIGPMMVRVYTDEGIVGIGEASSKNAKVLKCQQRLLGQHRHRAG